ncbi:Wzz/FepE/Etk N-terminal domain-containing protein [Edaphocola flava]|uniref:Wzz/FepE/Etk N-terminal domain-containing protein n=1 Tax=Edaphocola flava TaxID=2499629 RepID=UPI00100C257E|nr:Wzz/FepE/Etk N-terminal domain-containing protein [Edaphocola flava]
MQQNKYDLVAIIRTIKSRGKLVWGITALGLIASVIFVSIRPNEYTSEASIIVKGFMNFDRNQLYNDKTLYTKDVFAKDYELDKAMTILESGDVKGHINEAVKYQQTKKLKSEEAAFIAIKSAFKLKRTDNYDIEAKFTDTDPKLAHAALEAALQKAEAVYINFFEDYNRDVTKDIDFKRRSITDSINLLNDSIAAIRKQYNLYSELLPVRGTVLSNNQSINADNAVGIEKLQSLIQVKDQLDEQNAKLASLKNEYNSYLNSDKMHVFYRVSGPYVPNVTSNLPAYVVILGSVLASLIFASLLVLIANAFKNKA